MAEEKNSVAADINPAIKDIVTKYVLNGGKIDLDKVKIALTVLLNIANGLKGAATKQIEAAKAELDKQLQSLG